MPGSSSACSYLWNSIQLHGVISQLAFCMVLGQGHSLVNYLFVFYIFRYWPNPDAIWSILLSNNTQIVTQPNVESTMLSCSHYVTNLPIPFGLCSSWRHTVFYYYFFFGLTIWYLSHTTVYLCTHPLFNSDALKGSLHLHQVNVFSQAF